MFLRHWVLFASVAMEENARVLGTSLALKSSVFPGNNIISDFFFSFPFGKLYIPVIILELN